MSDLVDLDKERERLQKEKDNALQQIARIEGKLSNEGFVAKAPAAVVNAEREKLEKFRAVVAKLDDSLAALQ
jgi:valyl-tRNA synthetase